MPDYSYLERDYIIEKVVSDKFTDALFSPQEEIPETTLSILIEEYKKEIYTHLHESRKHLDAYINHPNDEDFYRRAIDKISPINTIDLTSEHPHSSKLDRLLTLHIYAAIFIKTANNKIREHILENTYIYNLLLYINNLERCVNPEKVVVYGSASVDRKKESPTIQKLVKVLLAHKDLHNPIINPKKDSQIVDNFYSYWNDQKLLTPMRNMMDSIDNGDYIDNNAYYKIHAIWLLMNLGLYKDSHEYLELIGRIVDRYKEKGNISTLPQTPNLERYEIDEDDFTQGTIKTQTLILRKGLVGKEIRKVIIEKIRNNNSH